MSSPTIQVILNGKVLQVIPFHKEVLSLGRMRENDIVIDNLSVSRLHAKLFLEEGRIILEDQESENGCFVNGERVTRIAITPRDEILIGKHQLVLAESEPPVPVPETETKSPSNPWDVSSTYVVDSETQQKLFERIAKKKLAEEPPATPPRQPHLAVRMPGGGLERHVWLKPTLSVGRSPECDLVLDQPQVSRRHAILSRNGEEYVVEDLDTGNGTRVNGVRKKKQALVDQDVIQVGDYEIFFSLQEPMPEGTGNKAEGAAAFLPAPDFVVQDTQEQIELAEVEGRLANPVKPPPPAATVAVVATPAVPEVVPEKDKTPRRITLEISIDLAALPPDVQEAFSQALRFGTKIPLEVEIKTKE